MLYGLPLLFQGFVSAQSSSSKSSRLLEPSLRFFLILASGLHLVLVSVDYSDSHRHTGSGLTVHPFLLTITVSYRYVTPSYPNLECRFVSQCLPVIAHLDNTFPSITNLVAPMAEPVVSTTEPLVTSDGSHEGFRNPDLERDADHYGPGTGGKKRKVPAFTQTLGRSDEGPDTKITDHPYPQTFPVRYRAPRSKAATACSFRKALFLRRKAALITLYIDAQNAVIAGTAKMGPNGKSPLMDVPSFEKLMPSLEDVGISDWPPDRPSWRTKWEETAPPRIKTLEQWKTKFAQRQRAEAARKPTVRGGWAPEGSFEFEKECEGGSNDGLIRHS